MQKTVVLTWNLRSVRSSELCAVCCAAAAVGAAAEHAHEKKKRKKHEEEYVFLMEVMALQSKSVVASGHGRLSLPSLVLVLRLVLSLCCLFDVLLRIEC